MAENLGLSHPAALRMAVRCDLGQVRGIAKAAHDFLSAKGVSERELGDCELALVEACNNAIQYAGDTGREQQVLVEMLCDEREVELRVTDHTAGFDWPLRAALPGTKKEAGR